MKCRDSWDPSSWKNSPTRTSWQRQWEMADGRWHLVYQNKNCGISWGAENTTQLKWEVVCVHLPALSSELKNCFCLVHLAEKMNLAKENEQGGHWSCTGLEDKVTRAAISLTLVRKPSDSTPENVTGLQGHPRQQVARTPLRNSAPAILDDTSQCAFLAFRSAASRKRSHILSLISKILRGYLPRGALGLFFLLTWILLGFVRNA